MKWIIGIAAVMLITHFFFRRARGRDRDNSDSNPDE
jgi:hypothetical protein